MVATASDSSLPSLLIDLQGESFWSSLARSGATAIGACDTGLPPFGCDPEDLEAVKKEGEVAVVVGQEDGGLWLFRMNLSIEPDGDDDAADEMGSLKAKELDVKDAASIITRRSFSSAHTPNNIPSTPRTTRTPVLSRTSSSSLLPSVMVSPPSVTKPFPGIANSMPSEAGGLSPSGKSAESADLSLSHSRSRAASSASSLSQITTATGRSRSRSHQLHHHAEFLPAPSRPSASTDRDISRSAAPSTVSTATAGSILPSAIIQTLPSQPSTIPSPSVSSSTASNALKNRLLATQKHSAPSETPDRLAALAAMGRGNLEGLKGKSSVPPSRSSSSPPSGSAQEKSDNSSSARKTSETRGLLVGLGTAFSGGSTGSTPAVGGRRDREAIKVEKAIDEQEEQEEELVAELTHLAEETERLTGPGMGLEPDMPDHHDDLSSGLRHAKRGSPVHPSTPRTPKSLAGRATPRKRCPVRVFPHSSLLDQTIAILPLSMLGLLVTVSAEGGAAILDTANVKLSKAFDIQAAARNKPAGRGEGAVHPPDLSPRLSWRGAEVITIKETEYLVVHGIPNEVAIPEGTPGHTQVVFLEVVAKSEQFLLRGKVDLPGAGPVKCIIGINQAWSLIHVVTNSVIQYDFHVGSNGQSEETPLRSTRSTANFASMFSPAPSRPASRAGSIKEGKPSTAADLGAGVAGFAKLLGKKNKTLSAIDKTRIQHAVTVNIDSKRGICQTAPEATWTGLGFSAGRLREAALPSEALIWIRHIPAAGVDHKGTTIHKSHRRSAMPVILTSEQRDATCVDNAGTGSDLAVSWKHGSFSLSNGALHRMRRGHPPISIWKNQSDDGPIESRPTRRDTDVSEMLSVENGAQRKVLGFMRNGELQQMQLFHSAAGSDGPELGREAGQRTWESAPVACFLTLTSPKTEALWVLAGSTDGTLRLWDVQSMQLIDSIDIFPESLTRVIDAAMPGGHALHGKVVLVSSEGSIGIFDVLDLDLLYIIPGAQGALVSIISMAEDLIISYSSGKSRVWNLASLEFRRSTASDAAEEMLEGGWRWILSPVLHRADAALLTCLPDFAHWKADPLQILQGFGSILTCSEAFPMINPGSKSPIIGTGASLGVRFEGYSITPDAKAENSLWSVSPDITGFLTLVGTMAARPLLANHELESMASTLISELSAVLPTVLDHTYIDASLDFLVKLFQNSEPEVHHSSRILLEARLARYKDMDAVALVDAQSMHLPVNLPTAAQQQPSAFYAVLVVGGLSLRRYNLFSSNTLKDIAASILLYIGMASVDNQILGIDLCHRGYHVWQNYVDPSELLRSLFALAVPKEVIPAQSIVAAHARAAVLHLAAEHGSMFITTLSMDIMDARSIEARGSVMRLCVFIARKKPKLLFPSIPRVAEAVVKSLDPTRVHMRESIQETATIILNELVKTYPTIDFASKVQRLAVGTQEGAVVMQVWLESKLSVCLPAEPMSHRYDLKTATRLYVVDAHQHRVSALAFSPDGRRLVTVSVDEKKCTVWKVGSSFSSLFNIGGLPRQGGGAGEPFRTFEFALLPEGQAIDPSTGLQAVDISWPADRSVCLSMGMVKMTFVT